MFNCSSASTIIEKTPLFRILIAYANVDPDIGYTQGKYFEIKFIYRHELCGSNSL
jgi:hypothetical protein